MDVLFIVNRFDEQDPKKIVEKCGKIFKDFPPEKLPHKGDCLQFNIPWMTVGNPTVGKRISSLSSNPTVGYDWAIEAKTDKLGLISELKRLEKWDYFG